MTPRLRFLQRPQRFMAWLQSGFAVSPTVRPLHSRLELLLLERRDQTNSLYCVDPGLAGITPTGQADVPAIVQYQTYATSDVSNEGGGLAA